MITTHFNLSAAEYEQKRQGAVEERRHRLVRQAIDERLPDIRHAIELGCGPGRFLADLAVDFPDIEFCGVDISPTMIEHACREHQRPNLRYEVRDITADNDPTTAQFAFSIDVLHHVHGLDQFFRAVRRVLEPGGTWLAVEPNVYHPYIFYSQERMRRAGFDEDHFRPWVAEPLLVQAGFEITSRGYASVFPGSMRHLPPLLRRLEQLCENYRFLGGSVVYTLLLASSGFDTIGRGDR
jgi:SAM-dependent methyltransferase